MDPITTAIIAAASAGIVTGLGQASQQGVQDVYNALKAVLKRKFGDGSDLVDAVEKVEEKPQSEARQALLQEEVETSGAAQDPEVKEAAETLLAEMQAVPTLAQYVHQIATGSYIAQASHGGTASVNVNRPDEQE